MKTRRHFIKTSSKIALATTLAPSIIRAQNLNQNKVRVAVIGVGGRGYHNVRNLSKYAELVAFCDVNDNSNLRRNSKYYKPATESYAAYPNVPRFKDYRVMFDQMRDQIDAVSVAVPDHMHYPIALWTFAEGKHLLMEKPLTRTFEEAMILKDAAKKSGVITQMGNQGHAGEGVRLIQEWIDAGIIGEVSSVYHWTDRPIWPQGMQAFNPTTNIPQGFDWNLWQGIAPKRSFHQGIAPFDWRGYRDYGSGAIGDIACHCMDASYTPLGLKSPTRIEAVEGWVSDIAFPSRSHIDFEFMSKFSKPITMQWMDGGLRPADIPFVPEDYKMPRTGTFIVGQKGTIRSDIYSKSIGLFPLNYLRELKQDKALPPKTLPRVKGDHFKEWIDAIQANKQPGSNIVDYAADFTATALLGTAAMAVEGSLDFDPTELRFTNNRAANDLLKSEYEYRKEFLPG